MKTRLWMLLWGVFGILVTQSMGQTSVITASLHSRADTNTWGQLLYTHYQSSEVHSAPLRQAVVCKSLVANETVKADFKSGNWYAVFKPSETVRSMSNTVGYMEAEDLFPTPLPSGPIAGGVGNSPAVATSIESMRPISPRSTTTSRTSSTSYQSPPESVIVPQSSPSSERTRLISTLTEGSKKAPNAEEPLSPITWSESTPPIIWTAS